MRRLITALGLILTYLIAPALLAQAQAGGTGVRTDTPSGYPVPRFVSLKNDETFCRVGPSFDHPVAVTYLKAGTPLLVVAETTDHWRKVRDADGAECWAHQTTLRAPNHVIVLEETALFAQRDRDSPVRARLAPRVMARMERSDSGWAKLSAEGFSGWAETGGLWGAGHVAGQD